MKQKFRKPSEIKVIKDPKQYLSCRIRKSLKDRLKVVAKLTPDKVPLAVLVEQVLEDYIKYVDNVSKDSKHER